MAEEEFAEEYLRVSQELSSQFIKWGAQNHADEKWLAILMEEVGEAAKDVLDQREAFAYWELIQVAAVAMNHARCIRLRRTAQLAAER